MTTGQEREKAITFPFSKTAELVIGYSNSEARKRHNSFLSTNHLILGLVKAALGGNKTIVESFLTVNISKFSLLSLWTEVARKTPEGNSTTEELAPLPLYSKVLKFAAEEAQISGDTEIRPIHILTGLIRQEVNLANPKSRSLTSQDKSGDYQIDSLRMLARNNYYQGRCKDEDKDLGKK
jgi:ATP-dependent Clp protease ATP-binding subunit ClpA